MKIEITKGVETPITKFFSASTPETDAAWSCFKGYMEPLQDVKDLSRKLERERDEAREELQKLEGAYEDATNYYYARIIELTCECDEAREKLDEEMKWHHRTHTELVQTQCKLLDMQMERDEACEELNDIRLNLGKDADGYTLIHAVCVLQNERDELLEKLSTTQTQTKKNQ